MARKPLATPRGAPLAWLRKHVAFADDGCLLWPFGRGGRGYAMIWLDGAMQGAHRVMCRMAHGPAPNCHQAAHSCGKGSDGCVNPRHLRWATHGENVRDRALHGVDNRGERHPLAVLSEADVLAIRKDARPLKEVASDFGVSCPTISAIRNKKSWAWLPEEE